MFALRELKARSVVWGPFLESPEMFSHPDLNLIIRELFYSHILTMKRGSIHTKRFRRVACSECGGPSDAE